MLEMVVRVKSIMIDVVPSMQRIEVRRRLGNENNSIFILHFARFALPLYPNLKIYGK